MTMSLTNTEFVAGLVTLLALFIVASLVLIGVAVAWIVLDYREDRRYLPRHSDTLTWSWPELLPPPRTPWDRPHPGYDVYPLTAGEMQVIALLWAVQRAELLHNVPQLQPSWVAQAAALCAREAGMLGERRVGNVARAERAGVRPAGQIEPRSRGAGTRPATARGTDGSGRPAVPAGRLLAAGTSREGQAG